MYQKGQSGNLNGRPKGAKDKSTSDIRERFADLLDNNLPNVEKWLNETAEKEPGKALELFLKLSEYVIPKLRATEIATGKNCDIFVTFPTNPEIEAD